MKRTLLSVAILLAIAGSQSGCMTAVNQMYGRRPYGGVQGNLEAQSEVCGDREQLRKNSWVIPLLMADLPFSFVGDTLLLPYTLPAAASRTEPIAANR